MILAGEVLFAHLQQLTPLSILLMRVNRLPSKTRAGFPLAVVMVDYNEMSIAANTHFMQSWTGQNLSIIARTLTYKLYP